MKCPNCSFSNPESAEICKVCGYDLHPHHEQEEPVDQALSALFGKDEETIEIALNESKSEPAPSNASMRIIFLFGAILILLVIFLMTSWSKMPWKYVAKELPEPPIQSEEPATVSLDPKAFIEGFYVKLDQFLISNNIAILTDFENPDSALDLLMEYKASIGNDALLVIEDISSPTPGVINVKAFIEAVDDSSTKPITWIFELKEQTDTFLITKMAFEILADEPTAIAPPVDEPQKPQPLEAKIPSGFIASGAFNGGSPTDGIDIKNIRYGDNVDFERIVFDLGAYGSEDAFEGMGSYSATISADGKSLFIELSGVRLISANKDALDVSASKALKSISFPIVHDDSLAHILIEMKQKSLYKVWYLTEPGRLIVDFIGQ